MQDGMMRVALVAKKAKMAGGQASVARMACQGLAHPRGKFCVSGLHQMGAAECNGGITFVENLASVSSSKRFLSSSVDSSSLRAVATSGLHPVAGTAAQPTSHHELPSASAPPQGGSSSSSAGAYSEDEDGTWTWSSFWQHRGVRLILGGWLFFTVENLVLSENRQWIIAKAGDAGYHFLYNTGSTLSLGCIALGYLRHGRRQGPRLWQVTRTMRTASVVTSLLGAVGLAQVLPSLRNPISFLGDLLVPPVARDSGDDALQPESKAAARRASLCPMDFAADRERERQSQQVTTVYGVRRITRHASLWSLALLSLGCALRTPFATEVCLFAGLLPCVCFLGWHMDSRFRRQLGGDMLSHHGADWPLTSHIPFLAIVMGEQEFLPMLNEVKPTNTCVAAAGVLLYAITHFRK
ncbi:unnamed protein product [Amoebophrya sp. A120]|nr:unnamed protein product [Amoebophrya sp. A120]|eukprot:GSA120T00017931001.1